ncbi:Nuclear transport factor 2 family protein [Nocardia ninae]
MLACPNPHSVSPLADRAERLLNMLLPARILRVSVATATAALAVTVGLAGCSSDDNKSDAKVSSSSVVASSSAAATGNAAAPTPETLQAVLVKLSDPAVPTAEKTKLIVDGEKRTANIDQMNKGLAGYTLTYAVADITTQGNTATAQVTITSPHGALPPMPLSWENVGGTWKLSDASGCLMLGFAQAPCVPA